MITGGSDGIGLECASEIARTRPGCRIVLVGRNPERTATAVGRIRREQADCTVDSFLCDFADQAAVRRLADDLLAACPRIDVLVNNAGTVFARRTLTADGIESTFAINHLGGLLLTELVLDRIKESAPARIVFTSSEGHYSGTMDLDDLNFEKDYTVLRAYCRSKLANVLTARLLARRPGGHRRHRHLPAPRRHRHQHLERRTVVHAPGARGLEEVEDGEPGDRRLAPGLPRREPRGRGPDRRLLPAQPAPRAARPWPSTTTSASGSTTSVPRWSG